MIKKALGPMKPGSAPRGLVIPLNQTIPSVTSPFLATSCCPKYVLLNQKTKSLSLPQSLLLFTFTHPFQDLSPPAPFLKLNTEMARGLSLS